MLFRSTEESMVAFIQNASCLLEEMIIKYLRLTQAGNYTKEGEISRLLTLIEKYGIVCTSGITGIGERELRCLKNTNIYQARQSLKLARWLTT